MNEAKGSDAIMSSVTSGPTLTSVDRTATPKRRRSTGRGASSVAVKAGPVAILAIAMTASALASPCGMEAEEAVRRSAKDKYAYILNSPMLSDSTREEISRRFCESVVPVSLPPVCGATWRSDTVFRVDVIPFNEQPIRDVFAIARSGVVYSLLEDRAIQTLLDDHGVHCRTAADLRALVMMELHVRYGGLDPNWKPITVCDADNGTRDLPETCVPPVAREVEGVFTMGLLVILKDGEGVGPEERPIRWQFELSHGTYRSEVLELTEVSHRDNGENSGRK